jgi:aspartate kinase
LIKRLRGIFRMVSSDGPALTRVSQQQLYAVSIEDLLGSIVCKFGGSSLANAEMVKKVMMIMASDLRRKYVVLSAPGVDASHPHKITDTLYNIYHLSNPNFPIKADYKKIDLPKKGLIDYIDGVYSDIASGFGMSPAFVSGLIDELVKLTSSNSNATLDEVVSRGENFNARLFAKLTGAEFMDPLHYMHLTRNGRNPDNRITMSRLAKHKPSSDFAVMPGFYGFTIVDGKHMTVLLPRGGSDTTGAIVAAGTGAKLYENWTDKNGVLACDPKFFSKKEQESLKVLGNMTYGELREAAYMGFTIILDEALIPVMKRGIPTNIRNTDPKNMQTGESEYNPGTVIWNSYSNGGTVKSIAGLDHFGSFNVQKYLMNKEIGFGRKLLQILEKNGISYEHAPSGIDNISVLVNQKQFEKEGYVGKEDEIISQINARLRPDKVDYTKDYALIAIVGEGMRHKTGIAAMATSALAEKGINIEILNQGSSENNIIIGVKSSDFKSAVRSLYYRLIANQ